MKDKYQVCRTFIHLQTLSGQSCVYCGLGTQIYFALVFQSSCSCKH